MYVISEIYTTQKKPGKLHWIPLKRTNHLT